MKRLVLATSVIAALASAQSKPAAESAPSAESRPQAAGAAAFAPCFRFCPAQIESLMCISHDLLSSRPSLADLGSFGDEEDVKVDKLPRWTRSVSTGSKFAFRGMGSTGDCRGVDVFEFARDLPPLSEVLVLENFTKETADGMECWRKAAEAGGGIETWLAAADGRFVITATRRALLQEALAKKGPTPEACIAALGWDATRINWSSPVVIVRKYDPANPDDAYSPVNAKAKLANHGFRIDGMTFGYEDAKRGTARIEVETRDPAKALAYFREVFGIGREPGAKPTTRVEQTALSGNRQTLSVTFEDDPNRPEGLLLAIAFGFNVFI